MSQRKYQWYWYGRHQGEHNTEYGWLHGGECLFAWKLQGYDAEPETDPARWGNKQCIVCGGENE